MAKTSHYKRGLSAVVTTMILVALSVAAVVLVWVFSQNLINKQIGNSEACFGNYQKIQINRQYTCYEKINSADYNLRFSLSIGDVKVDKVLVSISSNAGTKSYTITNTPTNMSGLMMYPSNATGIVLPGENSGLSYKSSGYSAGIDSIQIAPMLGGNLCEVSDSYSEIEDCALNV